MIRFGSVCSGIEAASVAWHPFGWQAAWLAEIEPFPSAVLAHHYPDVPNLGDMTSLPARILRGEVEAPDLLCGGTPCQAFSVAGKRGSLDDARGNLTLTFVDIADAIDHVRTRRGDQPGIVFWENVPGVLSTRDNAFGCFLGALAGAGCELQPAGRKWTDAGCVYGPERAVAWRVLDAQYFGLAQRRRRVFVVSSARAGFDPAAVLFELDGVRRDSAPRRGARQEAAAGALRSTDGGCDPNHAAAGHLIASTGDVAHCLNAGGMGRQDYETETMVVQAPVAFHPTQDPITSTDGSTHALGCGSKGGQASVAIAFSAKDYGADAGELSPTLRAMGHAESHANGGGQVAVAVTGDVFHTLRAEGFDASEDGTGRGAGAVATGMAVRRLMPRECERLQGFPDDYTLIPKRLKDGPRYKAIGNSWAVPCVRWIGARIDRALRGHANDNGQSAEVAA